MVREAISKLQAAGLVETRHGVGTFVVGAVDGSAGFALAPRKVATLRDVMAVLELRIGIETEAAGLAAQRRGARNLALLRDALDAFERSVRRRARRGRGGLPLPPGDRAGHANPHFAQIIGTLGQALIPRARAGAEVSKSERRVYLARVNAEHESILDAIAAQRRRRCTRGDAHPPGQQPRAASPRGSGHRWRPLSGCAAIADMARPAPLRVQGGSMKPRVLQYGRLMPSLEKQLAEAFDWHRLVDEADPKAFLAARGREFVGLATAGFADAALIDALPSLKVISSFGVGVDKIDLPAAAARGIPVGNTPDVLNDCVADLAIGLMIDVARGIGASERYLRAGSWPKGPYPLQRKVSGKKLGIVGLGRIGHEIAKRALAFNMDIRYHNRRPVVDTSIAHEPSLVELARWCDFLLLIVPGGAATQHLVNAAVLDALGTKGYADQRVARLGGRRGGAGACADRKAHRRRRARRVRA